MTWFKRARAKQLAKSDALSAAREKARDLGKETAELLGPEVLDPRADPTAVRDFLLAIVGAANLSKTFPELSPPALKRIHADFASSFWASINEQLEQLK